MKSFYLIGDFQEIRELAARVGIIISGCVDKNSTTTNELELHWDSDDDFLKSESNKRVFISPDSPAARRRLYYKYLEGGAEFISLCCPTAKVSPTARFNSFYCIQSNVNISSNVTVCKGVKINSYANIMHDCYIGDFTTVAPNAVLLGAVHVGEGAYIGANATILPGIEIEAGAIIGAGSVVTKNVSANTLVYGNPARLKYEK